ncbi:MAG TPA: RHS repeat-associated core domain-containing protein [Thermoanaerobaculia bacterium]|nr:RHS repeat-associated core domain-containing protein [Thermoanaerobaculia bacterium]
MRRAFFFIVAVCLATSSFASIPRTSMLDAPSTLCASLPETRIRVFDVLAPFDRPVPTPLNRALHQAYAAASTTNASGLGRFLSVDPAMDIKKALAEPQRWNRYAYVMNNPLRYTDPTGKNALVVCDPQQHCNVTVEAQIVANGRRQTNAANDFVTAAQRYWNGRTVQGPNGERLTINVNIAVVRPGQQQANKDTLTVVTGAGRSQVAMTLLRGQNQRPSAQDTGTIFTRDTTNNPSGMAGVGAHETGHLMGLPDLYPPQGVAAFQGGAAYSIMEMAQPTNSADIASYVLNPTNGNAVVVYLPPLFP